MAATDTIRVNLVGRRYDIEIGSGNIANVGRFLTERAETAHVVLITDENIHRPHAMRAAESLGKRDVEVDVVIVPPGEESKSPETLFGLWQGLLDLMADRQTVVAAIGGGVVGDLAGLAAATFMRGLRFLQVPTTLLAQVDSSVGGKVGVNLPGAKNMVGAFHQPVGVSIDVDALATLPKREYRAGLAEVVKYGATLDAEFFEFLEQNVNRIIRRDKETLIRTIGRCCRLKAGIVERDEREQSGLRFVLNFGHTFGHAYETLADGPLSHGEAVAIGMILAARLSERLGMINSAFVVRLRSLLKTFYLPVSPPECDPALVLAAMTHDKKVAGGRPRFVVLSECGQARLVDDVSESDIAHVLRR